MKTVATPCMIAVPSMLIVAPSGTVNEPMESCTPSRSSTVRRVTGSVAPLLAVPKATLMGARSFLKKGMGDTRANRRSIVGYVTAACSSSTAKTVKKYESIF